MRPRPGDGGSGTRTASVTAERRPWYPPTLLVHASADAGPVPEMETPPGAGRGSLEARPRPASTAASLALALLSLAPSRPLAEEDQARPCEASQALGAYGIGTAWDELARMAEDVGAAPLRPDMIRRAADRSTSLCAGGPALPLGRRVSPPDAGSGLELVPATLNVYGNSAYPRDVNDGAVWEGKGVSTQLSAGAAFRRGIFSAAVAPSVAWQQNAAFRIVPNGQTGNLAFMDPWYGSSIDYPQRFGEGPFWTASPGQSYLRLDYWGFAAAVSTENMWWGPAIRNSILMSNTAAGFPHALLGTGRPVDVGIGNLEAHVYMGRLDRSKYFSDQSHAWFYGLVMTYEPRWVPGLYLGFTGVNLKDCACLRSGNDTNSLLGLYGRWVFPSAGFEVYAEWTREDRLRWMSEFLKHIDHSAAGTVGLQKVWTEPGYWVRLLAEATDTGPSAPPQPARGAVAYYTHTGNLSYTNGGQLLGTGIGPGASGQYLGVDVLTPSGWYGAYLERVRRNDYVFLYMLGAPPDRDDVELTLGFRYARSLGMLDLGVNLAGSLRYNRDFIETERNVHLAVEVTFWPPPVQARF